MLRSHRTTTPLPPIPVPPDPQLPTPGMIEAMAARQVAGRSLMAAIERGSEVREVVRRVAEHGRQNHFIDLLDVTRIPGRRP